jgi:hypothetical protein
MQEAVRLKLQQVPRIAFLRLPEWPFEEPHIGKTEWRHARCDRWFDYSFRIERIASSHSGSECLWKSGADGSGYGTRANTPK